MLSFFKGKYFTGQQHGSTIHAFSQWPTVKIDRASKSDLRCTYSLYLTNLPEKLRKRDLRLSLYTLFATYGPVLDVVAMPGNKMRGQAWIAFRDTQASTQAMRSLQGFEFFGKDMTIRYAKGKSDTVAKLDGTYRMPTAAGATTTSTDLQQQIFGIPPFGLPAPVKAQQAPAVNGEADVTGKEESKGVKRNRDNESEEDVAMDEDSDAPMEEGSDDDD